MIKLTSLVLCLGAAVLLIILLRLKNIHLWILPYLYHHLRLFIRKHTTGETRPRHIMLAIVDHYEPFVGGVSAETAAERVCRTCRLFPEIAKKYKDGDGHHPKITCCYPLEDYDQSLMEKIAGMCRMGFGEVEVHYHHDNDTSENLTKTLSDYRALLKEQHGLLSMNKFTHETQYAFVHGNWALDNSRKDGKYCGVNDELTVLANTGCYADFTLPSAPSDTQTSMVNSIYYAVDNPLKPKSHNTGAHVSTRENPVDEGLMIIQGPLALEWKRRKYHLLPRIENGDLAFSNPPDAHRMTLWLRQHIHVHGRPEWVFIKLHTHSADPANADVILGKPMDDFLSDIMDEYNDGRKHVLHFVTAREMYNIIKAAEGGLEGAPGHFRNHVLVSNQKSDDTV